MVSSEQRERLLEEHRYIKEEQMQRMIAAAAK